jgi:hypothetical protein
MFPSPERWYHRKIFIIAAAAFVAVFVLYFGGAAWRAQAQSPQPGPPPEAAEVPDTVIGPHTCDIQYVGVFVDAVRVECKAPYPSSIIWQFAPPTDPAQSLTTNRMMTIMNTAFALNKPIIIYFYNEQTYNPSGCTFVCRKIYSIYMAQ